VDDRFLVSLKTEDRRGEDEAAALIAIERQENGLEKINQMI